MRSLQLARLRFTGGCNHVVDILARPQCFRTSGVAKMTVAASLEDFYAAWSNKDRQAIEGDIAAAGRKLSAIASGLAAQSLEGISRCVEVGCGYGGFIAALHERWGLEAALGVDFSATAIEYAQQRFVREGLSFHRCTSLDPQQTADLVRNKVCGTVDCIALIDVLEHIPDALAFVRAMAVVCPRFLIKLPVESSWFDNYCMPKEYPGSRHSNGHVREFDADSVFYFVRQLGLTPVDERLYIYDMEDAFPPPPSGASFKGRMFRQAIMMFKRLARVLLPAKWFLRLVGGGGYYCVAYFNEAHVLRP